MPHALAFLCHHVGIGRNCEHPTVGERVLTSDGESLGEVKEISGSYFKVDVSMGRDYWLNASSVTTIEDGAVCLSFPKSDLDWYKRGAPDP